MLLYLHDVTSFLPYFDDVTLFWSLIVTSEFCIRTLLNVLSMGIQNGKSVWFITAKPLLTCAIHWHRSLYSVRRELISFKLRHERNCIIAIWYKKSISKFYIFVQFLKLDGQWILWISNMNIWSAFIVLFCIICRT